MNLQNLKKTITRVIFKLTHPCQLRDVENNETARHGSLHRDERDGRSTLWHRWHIAGISAYKG